MRSFFRSYAAARYAVLLVSALAGVLAAGCGSERCTEPECWKDLPRIAFAVTAYNAAWAHTYSGWYIDRAGSVLAFFAWSDTADGLWAIEEDGFITLSELAALEEHGTWLDTTVDSDSVRAMQCLVAAAAEGKLSDEPRECADCGLRRQVGFLKDCKKKGYRVVLLYQGGDEPKTNQSPEAGQLHEWLERVTSGFPFP
jgi:hypothetical protein